MKKEREYCYEHPKIMVHDVEGFAPFCDISDVEDEETLDGGEEEVIEESCGRRRNIDSLW